MSTSQETAQYILKKLGDNHVFSVKRMFGEFALYAQGKVVGFICDDQLYVKITPQSADLETLCEKDECYPGSKPYYLVEESLLDSYKKLPSILRAIAATLPVKQPKQRVGVPKEDSFSGRVIALARRVPEGRVTTYGELARAAGGGAMAAQSITAILGKAYDRGVTDIPFHRIVYSDGRVWMAPEYEARRKALYKKEKIELDENGKIKNFPKKLFVFKGKTKI